MLKVCIDTNIWISGIVFSGKPAKVVEAAFDRKFDVVLSQHILDEFTKNLMSKFDYDRKDARRLTSRMTGIADLYEPSGSVKIVPDGHPDNMILETAHIGRAKYLVTGDKEHLLPLKKFKHVKIVDAAEFLNILTR